MKFFDTVFTKLLDITLTESLLVVIIGLLGAGLFSWRQSRTLQKNQFRFERSKLFLEEKKEMYSDFLRFYRGLQGIIYKAMQEIMDEALDKEKEITEAQISKAAENQISKVPESQISEITKLANDITANVRIYGDADLIDALNRCVKEISSLTKSKIDIENVKLIIREGERLVRAFRKNMGHDDSKLRAGSIMAIDVLEYPDPNNPEQQQDIASRQDVIFAACEGEKYKWLNDD